MQVVNEITCVNNGGFDLKFEVCWNGGSSGWSDYYSNPDSRHFQLNNFNIPEGAAVWITVKAALGKTHSSGDNVEYSSSVTANATYSVTGGLDNFSISLQGN